jgi:hypothetical protein
MSAKGRAARRISARFPDRCVICGGAIVEAHTADHFTPQTFSRALPRATALGLVFPAHAACNNVRGHSVASREMIVQAALMLADLSDAELVAAFGNIAAVEATLRAHADALAALRAETRAAVEREAARGRAAE